VFVGWWGGTCAASVRQEVHGTTKHSEWLIQGGKGTCIWVAFVWRKESCVECHSRAQTITLTKWTLNSSLWTESVWRENWTSKCHSHCRIRGIWPFLWLVKSV